MTPPTAAFSIDFTGLGMNNNDIFDSFPDTFKVYTL